MSGKAAYFFFQISDFLQNIQMHQTAEVWQLDDGMMNQRNTWPAESWRNYLVLFEVSHSAKNQTDRRLPFQDFLQFEDFSGLKEYISFVFIGVLSTCTQCWTGQIMAKMWGGSEALLEGASKGLKSFEGRRKAERERVLREEALKPFKRTSKLLFKSFFQTIPLKGG